jgi:hypothetical protein
MAKHKDEETKSPATEMSRLSDAKSAPGADTGDEPHHIVHLDSERVSRLRKRPTRY